MVAAFALLLLGASPLLPLVARSWQRSSRAWLRAVGLAIAPFALWVAFDVSLLGMGGGIALMRFRLDGPIGVGFAIGFVLLQPVGIVAARRIAREVERESEPS